MRLLALIIALGAVNAAVLAPAPTPRARLAAVNRRQATTAAPAATSSLATFTYAWYSGGESDGVTLWVPITYQTESFSWTSSGDYFRGCASTLYITQPGGSVSAMSTDNCFLWTTCSLGYLVAESTSLQCVGAGYDCYTELLYSTWGQTRDALSWLYCGETSSNITNTKYYRTKPPGQVPVTPDDTETTTEPPTSTPVSTPNPSPTTSTAEPTTPAPAPAAPAKNNTPIIAGSVVGGVAVICAAVVAVLYILRRNRNHNVAAAGDQGGAPPPTSSIPVYQPDKPVGVVNVGGAPEYHQGGSQPYDPHASMYSTGSPPPHSPVPAYQEQQGWSQHQAPVQRNELQG